MNQNTRFFLAIAAGLLVGILILVGIILLYWNFSLPQTAERAEGPLRPTRGIFESNGERIYFIGKSRTGPAITYTMPGMHRMGPGSLGCANCHGEDARGGSVNMMMTTIEVPDIRYSTLTETHEEEHEADGHPPYTDETIIEAITEGVNPAGEALYWAMPRWDMTEGQLDDLLAFLKTLQ